MSYYEMLSPAQPMKCWTIIEARGTPWKSKCARVS